MQRSARNVLCDVPHAMAVFLTVCAVLTAATALHADEPSNAGADTALVEPAPLDMDAARSEVAEHYAAAHPQVREYVLHTAGSFGRSGLWLNENAFTHLTPEQRDAHGAYLAQLLDGAEYGRHLCRGLAHASALDDPRLLSGLIEVAAYHVDDRDYDCRPKWMAVAALARQDLSPPEAENAQPGAADNDENRHAAIATLIHLTDHGNQNTRFWARAALARHLAEGLTEDLGDDKTAWAKHAEALGFAPIPEEALAPYTPPNVE